MHGFGVKKIGKACVIWIDMFWRLGIMTRSLGISFGVFDHFDLSLLDY